MLEDIALCGYRRGGFSMDELKSTISDLLRAAYRDSGVANIPR